MNQREVWERRVRSSTTGMTAEQVQATIDRLVAAPEGSTCVWHEAAAVCGGKCCCARCRPDIRRFA